MAPSVGYLKEYPRKVPEAHRGYRRLYKRPYCLGSTDAKGDRMWKRGKGGLQSEYPGAWAIGVATMTRLRLAAAKRGVDGGFGRDPHF